MSLLCILKKFQSEISLDIAVFWGSFIVRFSFLEWVLRSVSFFVCRFRCGGRLPLPWSLAPSWLLGVVAVVCLSLSCA